MKHNKPKCESRSVRMTVMLPRELRAEVDRLRREGYSTGGYVKFLIENDLERRRSDAEKLART